MRGSALQINKAAKPYSYLLLLLFVAMAFTIARLKAFEGDGRIETAVEGCSTLHGGAYFLACGKMDIRSATQEDFEAVPGIGVNLARSIITYRDEHGIKSWDDLLAIHGIGKRKSESLKDYFYFE